MPPALAGRDGELTRAVEALRAGPRHPMFRHGYYGPRGVGKTVLVDAVARTVREDLDWVVVDHQAIADENLLAALLAKVSGALREVSWRQARALRGIDRRLTVGVSAVVRAEATLASRRPVLDAETAAAVEDVIVRLGDAAAGKDRGVLIVIDEIHAARLHPDLAAFARVLQVAARRSLPVAVILAGLPGTREHLARAGTFTERLHLTRIGDLTPTATRLALVQPAADLGVRFAAEALDELVTASGGYPYFVQLHGYWTWEAAGGAKVVSGDHARQGVREGTEQAASSLFAPRWARLSPLEAAYVAAVAAAGETAATGGVAAALGRTQSQTSTVRAALINEHHLLEASGYGKVRFTIPGFAAWVRTGAE